MLNVVQEPVNYCCEGCGRVDVEDKSVCMVYAFPATRWRLGNCPLATHVKAAIKAVRTKVRVGQQKQRITI
jgi:hypothetical protein